MMLQEYEDIVNDQRESTSKELKVNLREALRKSGVLQNVKAQIRKEFIVNLTGKHKFKAESVLPTHQERIIASAIYHYFQRLSLLHTLSVYSAECSLDSHTVLSEVEIVQALNIGYHSNVYKRFVIYNENNNSNKATLLSMLIEEIASKALRGNHDSSTQTDSSGPTARENLETNIRELQTSFLNRRDIERLQPMRSIEEKMLTFQRECEERYRKELNSQMTYVRETEISKIKFEENKNTQQRVEIIKRQLETEYQIKLQHQIQKESELLQNLNDKEKQMQQTNYELRQKYQLEIESLQNREIALTKKTELESQGLKFLENRLKEMSLSLETKEKELNRMENDLKERMKLKIEDIKNEKLAHLQHEFDLLIREKNTLKIEKKKVEEIHSENLSKLEAFDELRRRLRDTLLILEEKEDEVAMLTFKLSRLQWNESHVEVADRDRHQNFSGDSNINNQSANIQQILEKNNELELQLQKLSEELLQMRRIDRDNVSGVEEKQKINRSDATKKMNQIIRKYEQEKNQWIKDRESLVKDLKVERSKVKALESELASLSQLCKEQRAAIHSLPKATTSSTKRKQLSDSATDLPPVPPTPAAPPLTASDITAMLQAALTLSGRSGAADGTCPPYWNDMQLRGSNGYNLSQPFQAPYFAPHISLQSVPYSIQQPLPMQSQTVQSNAPSSENPISDVRSSLVQNRLDEVRKNVSEKTNAYNEPKNPNEISQNISDNNRQQEIEKMKQMEELKREQERELYELRQIEIARIQQMKVQREEEDRLWRRSRDEARRQEERLEAEEREKIQLEQFRRIKEREEQLYNKNNTNEASKVSVESADIYKGKTIEHITSTFSAVRSQHSDYKSLESPQENTSIQVNNNNFESVDKKLNNQENLRSTEAKSVTSTLEHSQNESNHSSAEKELQKQQDYEIEQQQTKEIEAIKKALQIEAERIQRERELAEEQAEKQRLLKMASDAAIEEEEEKKRLQALAEEQELQRKLADIERQKKDAEKEKAAKEMDEVEKKKKEEEEAIKRKKEEDAAAIQAARAKVLARRKQKTGGAKEVEPEPEPVPVPEPVKTVPLPTLQSTNSTSGIRDNKNSHRGLNQSEDDDLENMSFDGNDDSGEGIVWK